MVRSESEEPFAQRLAFFLIGIGLGLLQRLGFGRGLLLRAFAQLLGVHPAQLLLQSGGFGGRGLRSTRYTIPAALCGDCMAVVLSVVSIRLFG